MINDERTLKQYTFYYESQHYDIPNWDLFPNRSISILDDYNNSITYNASLFLTINHEIILHYDLDTGFNEIQKSKAILPIISAPINPDTRRRLRRGRTKKKNRRNKRRHRRRKRSKRRSRRRNKRRSRRRTKKRRRKSKRKSHRKDRSAVARWLSRWKKRQLHKITSLRRKHKKHKHVTKKNRYAAQGRFVGYFNSKDRGTSFKGAHSWCKRKYGELASIGNSHENEQVQRVCRVILGDNRRNGYYCWLGLFYPFLKWTDKRDLDFVRYSPKQKHFDEKGLYTGTDKCTAMYKRSGYWYHQSCNYRNGVVCSKPRGMYVDAYIVVQKQYRFDKAKKICKQWYGTNLATIHNDEHNRNVRRACQRASDDGHCWIGLEEPFTTWSDNVRLKYTNWADGEPSNRNKEGCTEIYPSGRWNNIPCRVHRYPVCNGRSAIERMDGRLREYLIRKTYMEFRRDWLRNQQKRWYFKQRRKQSESYKFKQNMMKQMKMKVFHRYKENLATKFWNAQQGANSERKMGYEPLLTKNMMYGMYYQKYGRFPPIRDPAWMRKWLKRLQMQKKYKQRMRLQYMRKRNAKRQSPQMKIWIPHKHIYGDLDTKPYDGKSLSISPLNGMNSELKMIRNNFIKAPATNDNRKKFGFNNINTPRLNNYPSISSFGRRRLQMMEEEDEDRKCVLVANINGLQEICVGVDSIDIKRFIKREMKVEQEDIVVIDVVDYGLNEISNVSDVAVDYVDFENWKYKKGVFINEYKMLSKHEISSVGYKYNLIENAEEEIYEVARYNVMVDAQMGDMQCWHLLDEDRLQLCVTVNDADNNVIFEVAKEVYTHDFDDDRNWDEVIMDVEDDIVSKCIHLLGMKICIEIEHDPQRKEWDSYELTVLKAYNEHDHEIFL